MYVSDTFINCPLFVYVYCTNTYLCRAIAHALMFLLYFIYTKMLCYFMLCYVIVINTCGSAEANNPQLLHLVLHPVKCTRTHSMLLITYAH